MILTFRLLAWLLLICGFCLAVEELMDIGSRQKGNEEAPKGNEICLQCEKKRIIVFSNRNSDFYKEARSQLKFEVSKLNFSKQPKCYYQYQNQNQKYLKKERPKTSNKLKDIYQSIVGWINSVLNFPQKNNKDDYKNCVNCQKITKISRKVLHTGRSHLSINVHERIFNFFKSRGQCPNQDFNVKHYVFRKTQHRDAFYVGADRDEQTTKTNEDFCIECSKVKRIMPVRYAPCGYQTNFKEYIITEIFGLKKWKENLLHCVNIGVYVQRIFRKRDKKQFNNLDDQMRKKGEGLETEKKGITVAPYMGAQKMLMGTEYKPFQGKSILKLNVNVDANSQDIVLKTSTEKNIIKGKRGTIRQLLTEVENKEHTVLPFWVVFRLSCSVVQATDSLEAVSEDSTEQKSSSKSSKISKVLTMNDIKGRIEKTERKIRELLKYTENKKYSYLPFWTIFKLSCPVVEGRKATKKSDGSLGAPKMYHIPNKTMQAEREVQKLLRYTIDKRVCYFSLWVILKLKCFSRLRQEKLREESSHNLSYRANDEIQIKRKLIERPRYASNKEFSYLPFWMQLRLKCPSEVRKLVKGRGLKDSFKKKPEKMSQRLFPKFTKYFHKMDTGRKSLIQFGVLFRLKCKRIIFEGDDRKSLGLIKQKQTKSKYKMFFMQYTGKLHSVYLLPFSKCSLPDDHVNANVFKLSDNRPKLHENEIQNERKPSARFQTPSSNKLEHLVPEHLVPGPTLPVNGREVQFPIHKPKMRPLEVTNSKVCFRLIGIFFLLKCQLKDFNLERKSETPNVLVKQISKKENDTKVRHPNTSDSLLTTTDLKTQSRIDEASNEKEFLEKMVFSSHEKEGQRYDFSLQLPNLQNKHQSENVDIIQSELPLTSSSKSIDKTTVSISAHTGSVTETKIEESGFNLREEKAVEDRFPKVMVALRGTKSLLSCSIGLVENNLSIESRILCTAEQKDSHIPETINIKKSVKLRPDASSASNTIMAPSSDIPKAVHISETINIKKSVKMRPDTSSASNTAMTPSSGVPKDVPISTSDASSFSNTTMTSSDFSRTVTSSASKVTEYLRSKSVSQSDFRLHFEATKSMNEPPNIMAVETSSISLIPESLHESSTIKNENTDKSIKLTTSPTKILDSVSSLDSHKDSKQIPGLASGNITRTSSERSFGGSDSGSTNIDISPFSVKADLPSHSQPNTVSAVQNALTELQGPANLGHTLDKPASKAAEMQNDISVKEPIKSESDDEIEIDGRKEDIEKGESMAVSADVVVLFTLFALACYKALKTSLGRMRSSKPNQEISDDFNNGSPPNQPDLDQLITSTETQELEEKPSTQTDYTDNQNRKLELETVIAVAALFKKPNGEIGFEIRHSQAG